VYKVDKNNMILHLEIMQINNLNIHEDVTYYLNCKVADAWSRIAYPLDNIGGLE
jgi:hypothetical protein